MKFFKIKFNLNLMPNIMYELSTFNFFIDNRYIIYVITLLFINIDFN